MGASSTGSQKMVGRSCDSTVPAMTHFQMWGMAKASASTTMGELKNRLILLLTILEAD